MLVNPSVEDSQVWPAAKSDPTMTQQAIRKAAVLIQSLDMPSRQALLGQMEPIVAQQVEHYAISMGTISPDEREVVIREFLSSASQQPQPSVAFTQPINHNTASQSIANPQVYQDMAHGGSRPNHHGVGSDANVYPGNYDNSSNAFGTYRYAVENNHNQSPATGAGSTTAQDQTPTYPRAFEFLHRMQSIEVALLLAAETVQVQAVVLSNIDREYAAEIIQLFDKHQQVDVIRRMSDMQQVDSHSMEIIAGNLISRCRQQINSQPTTPASSFNNDQPIHPNHQVPRSETHQQPPSDHYRPEAPALKIHSPTTSSAAAQKSQHPVTDDWRISFEQLMQIDNANFDILLQTARPELTIVALRGAERYIVKRVLSRLPGGEAKEVERLIKDLGPIKISEIRDAQQYLVHLALGLLDDGKMNFKLPKQNNRAAAA